MPPANSGFHHIAVGDITVTALNDGMLQGAFEVITGAPHDEAEAMLRASHRVIPPKLTVNAFLIRKGGHVTLVDTGSGALMGPTLGLLPARLAAIGVAPDTVNTVLMTHLHIDHVAGLADADGHALFPNAELVMHEAEAAFWLDGEIDAGAPDAFRQAAGLARSMTAPYAGRIRRAGAGSVLPGVMLHPLPGHTPGHSGFLVEDGGDAVLIWGDIVHLPGLQFARPEIGVVFDADPAMAVATRARALDMAATDRLRIAGMHLDFPTFAHVVRDGAGGYAAVPEVWLP